MKRLLFLLFPICAYSWLIFCISYPQATEDEPPPAAEVQRAAIASEFHLNPEPAQERADPIAAVSLKNARKLSEDFTPGNQANALEACQQLGKKLKNELKPLFQNCTAADPARKELCLFLKPIEKDVKILQGNDLQASTAALQRLKEQLTVYRTF